MPESNNLTNVFNVTAKILHKESGSPLPDLHVALFDLDGFIDPDNPASTDHGPIDRVTTMSAIELDINALYVKANRLFSGLTDERGQVAAEITQHDFNSGGEDNERKPDMILAVMAAEEPGLMPSDRLLYLSNDFRLNAGSTEAFLIKLNSKLLESKGISIGNQKNSAPVEEIIAAHKKGIQENDLYERSIREIESKQTKVKQAELSEHKDKIKHLFIPQVSSLAIPTSLAPSTFVEDTVKVETKIDSHNLNQINYVNQSIETLARKNKGIAVKFVLTEQDRRALNFANPAMTQPDSASVPVVHDFPDMNAEPIKSLLAKMNSAGDANLVLTSNNPILKKCLTKTEDTLCAKGNLHQNNGNTGANNQPQNKVIIQFADLPDPAKKYIVENYGGEEKTYLIYKIVNNNNQDEFLVNLLNNVTVKFDRNGETHDNDLPLTAEEIGAFVKRTITNLREAKKFSSNAAHKPDQQTVNENIKKFSLKKGPAELPSFHDFQVLNIAFGHIWQQLIDETPTQLAAELKQQGRARGFSFKDIYHNQAELMADFVVIGRILTDPPVDVTTNFDITYEEWNSLDVSAQNKLSGLASEIDYAGWGIVNGTLNTPRHTAEVYAQEMREKGELLIDYIQNSNTKSFHKILTALDNAIKSNYAFNVFGADDTARDINFGLLNTYRQCWEPCAYQCGDLVKSIPLSPKEERKYSLKTTFTRKRSEKEARKNNTSLTQETNTTVRAEEEIIAKAQSKNDFKLTTDASYGKWTVNSSLGLEASKDSSQTKKDFRESTIKAAQEFKEERSVEITTEETYSSEYNESGTIVNPNDELAVTYLFYELQKRFKVSEQLNRVMPVVCVAQPVPKPSEITEAWVIAHDWILNRALLDDSFRPGLQYIAQKNVGDDYAIRELRRNLRSQRQLVATLKRELAILNSQAESRYKALEREIDNRIDEESERNTDSWWEDVGEFFGAEKEDPEGAKAREMAARDAQAYAAEKAQKMALNLQREVNALQGMTAEYTKALREHLNKRTMIDRLLLHFKNNIIYYMQAIWMMEPPDQRYMRLLNVQIPSYDIESMTCVIQENIEPDLFKEFRKPDETLHQAWLKPKIKRGEDKPLVEVADLDNLLGFKGNYMVFRLKQHNAITQMMSMPYIDAAFGAMDPDQLSNVSLEDYAKYVCCLREELPDDEFKQLSPTLKAWLDLLLSDPLRNGDEIIVPTNSLYIEMLLSANSLLEDFKLQHREWDVYKVQEEVEMAALENLRIAKRILLDELEDPKIDKKVVVERNVGANIDVADN